MAKRDIIIATVCAILGFGLGIAVCPKRTGTPLDNFNTYLSSFYCNWDGDEQGIKRAFYQDGEIGQSLLFDDVWRIIGVEYTIPLNLYERLSKKEQQEWHKNDYAYKSGMLIASNLINGDPLCRRLSNKYSKTIILWKPNDKIPSGYTLWYNFEDDGEIIPLLIQQRDRMLSISTTNTRNKRNYVKSWRR